jgi:hypothetical protein
MKKPSRLFDPDTSSKTRILEQETHHKEEAPSFVNQHLLLPQRKIKIGNLVMDTNPKPYLLGLLAMIKCSICSYQCDN